MTLFPSGHATHPQWRMALAMVLAQLRAQMAQPGYATAPRLGVVYITDHYASEAEALLDSLAQALPEVSDWSGTVGVGVAACNAEYFDEPALSVMLLDLPAEAYRVFSGLLPLPQRRMDGVPALHTALVHADGQTPELSELLGEVAARTSSGYLFGGVTASRSDSVQFARVRTAGPGTAAAGPAGGVLRGGLSGVAFGAQVPLITRVTQGCQPMAPAATITEAQDNVVLRLNGEPALDVLLRLLDVTLEGDLQPALRKVRATLVGLTDGAASATAQAPGLQHTGHLDSETRVRHIVGLDGARRGVALTEPVAVGMQLTFCQRHVAAARADLMRICAEIREELEPAEATQLPLSPAGSGAVFADSVAGHRPAHGMRGAIYVSCSGRGGPYFGGPSAELQWLRHALGDVPLVGFFAGGEIAHQHLYGYTGVLTVFAGTD